MWLGGDGGSSVEDASRVERRRREDRGTEECGVGGGALPTGRRVWVGGYFSIFWS